MQHTRHISPSLFDDAWQITDAQGQCTARVSGTQQEAVALARHQLAAYGGGPVLVVDAS